MTTESERIRVFTLVDHYLPGFRHGGPIRTIANLVSQMPEQFEFWLYTRDHDQGDRQRYSDVAIDEWNQVGRARVYYASRANVSASRMVALIRSVSPGVVYANSLFSRLTVRCFVARRVGALRALPLIVAPRGELATSALRLKAYKKRPFIRLALRAGLFRGIVWQASTELEKADIIRALTERADIRLSRNVSVAPDLVELGEHRFSEDKSPGRARFVFFSRVARVKNLLGAIRYLRGVRGDICLDVYGPIEDAAYWRECRAVAAREIPRVRLMHHGVLRPEQVAEVLQGYDFLVLPTEGENFGHVIIEALAAGRPVVISDRTPWRALARQGAGWDLPLADTNAWKAALQACVDMDRATHKGMCRKALKVAVEALQREDALRQNVALFAQVVRTWHQA